MAKNFPLDSAGFHPFGELIGFSFTRCEAGFSRCVLELAEKLINPHGVLHGGAIYSMADTGMGAALYGYLEDDELCTTIEIKIMYYAPVTRGTVTCDTKLVHKTRRIASLESDVFWNEKLVARAVGTFYIFKQTTPQTGGPGEAPGL